MAIDEDLVRRLEELAALHLADDERALVCGRLARVVAYVEQLSQLDTTGREPCAHVADLAAPRRPDEPRPSLPPQDALGLAPLAEAGFFRVPPALTRTGQFPADEDAPDG